MTTRAHQDALRQRHPSSHRRGHQGRPDRRGDHPRRDRRVRRHRRDPRRTTPSIFDAYRETPNKPHEGIAIWVSGFFGSGKSSFAKMLGLSIENRAVAGESAAERFAAARRRQEAPGAAEGHHREDPDPRRHLRRLDRPRHPQRQPDAHRDHVRALPPEPRLREGPRPLRAGDRARGEGAARRVRGRVPARSSTRTGTPRRARSRSRSARRAA